MRPIIGITCNQGEEKLSINRYYGEAVIAAAGIPVILPAGSEEEVIKDYVNFLDGLLLTGGGDLDPYFFGEEPQRGLGEISPARDSFEIRLCQEFLQNRKPIFAICRGVQVLNVAAGGTLIQDLNRDKEGIIKHSQQAPKWYATHQIILEEGSFLAEILEMKLLRVNSFHHQAVQTPATGFKIAARSLDGVVEALEALDGSFVLGVQWHPECMWERDTQQKKLFSAFIKETRKIKINNRNFLQEGE